MAVAPTLDTEIDGEPSRLVVINALGLTQVFAWGTSYYLPAVFAKPIADEMGWPLSLVVGGVSLGLLVAGLVSPWVGRIINQQGGRLVLAGSSVLLAAGLGLLGTATSLLAFAAAWLVLGVGMGAGLYDAAFSTLGRYYGSQARSAITALTLWGGFASTVCWPLSAYLIEALGWRGACLTYAALQLAFSLPVHLFLLPKVRTRQTLVSEAKVPRTESELRAARVPFLTLAGLMTVTGIATSIFSMHLLVVLQARDIALGATVALGALVGPSQVAARLVEMMFGKSYHPIWSMVAATILMALGLNLLWAGFPVIAAALILYGAGNGIFSIARGALPLALFGPERYATIMGRLALPALLAQAAGPSVGALVLDTSGPSTLLFGLASLASVNLILVAVLWLQTRRV